VFYDSKNLPNSSTILNDLQKLIGTYRELKSIVGNDILDINFVLDEEEYQTRAQAGNNIRTPKQGKTPKKKKLNGSASSTWWRDPDMAYTAIFNADFKCENDSSHKTFLSSVTSQQFVEAHHLIPMEFQNEFTYSIDLPENIISLCPNCHRAFHNSIDTVRIELIKKFYDKRISLLQQNDIRLSEKKLLEYYKTTPNKT
jgi:5-methylcytosine-specific restriction protein A